jgi:hypothetical protein
MAAANGVVGQRPVTVNRFILKDVPNHMDVVMAYAYRVDAFNPHLLTLTTQNHVTIVLRVDKLSSTDKSHEHLVIGEVVEMYNQQGQLYTNKIGWKVRACLDTASPRNGRLAMAKDEPPNLL